MMMDKNGREIRTGDVVRIANAFFKNDNGIYFVSNSPGDPSWSGNDYSLRKICKNGKISTAKYNICFWPIVSYVSDRVKTAVAHDWNKAYATIEVIDGIDRTDIRGHFENEAENSEKYLRKISDEWGWGKHSSGYIKALLIRDHYRAVVASIS